MQNVSPKVIKNARFNLPLLIYTLINTTKNYTTIHLRSNLANVLEYVILLMINLIEYVLQIKQMLLI